MSHSRSESVWLTPIHEYIWCIGTLMTPSFEFEQPTLICRTAPISVLPNVRRARRCDGNTVFFYLRTKGASMSQVRRSPPNRRRQQEEEEVVEAGAFVSRMDTGGDNATQWRSNLIPVRISVVHTRAISLDPVNASRSTLPIRFPVKKHKNQRTGKFPAPHHGCTQFFYSEPRGGCDQS
jgi:hypothetical protein